MNSHHVWMTDHGRRPRFATKALDRLLVKNQLGMQQLDRDVVAMCKRRARYTAPMPPSPRRSISRTWHRGIRPRSGSSDSGEDSSLLIDICVLVLKRRVDTPQLLQKCASSSRTVAAGAFIGRYSNGSRQSRIPIHVSGLTVETVAERGTRFHHSAAAVLMVAASTNSFWCDNQSAEWTCCT